MSSLRANRRGIIALIIALGAFTTNDALVKLVARNYPPGEVMLLRGLMTVVAVAAMMAMLGQARMVRQALAGRVLARSLFDALGAACFVTALVHMGLAELSAVLLVSPLIMTALSVLLNHETVGWRRWTAIAVGFVGTLFVVKPTPSAFDAWALLGLGAAFAGAARDLMTRHIDPGVPASVISLSALVAVMLVGALLGLGESWRMMSAADIGLLACAAAFLGAGTYLVVIAYRDSEVSLVAPFRYTLLLWSGLAGYVVFGELPDRFAIIGGGLIVASGLYALHREGVRRREKAARDPE
jgi:drug/metabolite transporter (DMT)-like permease